MGKRKGKDVAMSNQLATGKRKEKDFAMANKMATGKRKEKEILVLFFISARYRNFEIWGVVKCI